MSAAARGWQIAQLPSGQHETKLVGLVTKLDLDLPELREEFAELVEAGRGSETSSSHGFANLKRRFIWGNSMS